MPEINRPILSAFADECSRDFNEQLRAVQRNGISHIEIRQLGEESVNTLKPEAAKALKKLSDDAGIQFSALGSGLGKCKIEDKISDQVEMCRRLIEVAHILDTKYIRMFSFRIPQDQNADAYREQVIDSMGQLVEVAKGTGVMLAHENEKHIYGETPSHCLDLYKTFSGSGAFCGVFDFANFIQAGHDPLKDCWPLLRDHTEYFHIKDAMLENGKVVPAGHGNGSMREILKEKMTAGFDSFLTIEPHLGPAYGETSDERFDCAATALKALLEEIG